MWTIFYSLYWLCYNIASVFIFWCLGHKACGILAPQLGTESVPPALEDKVLTTGLPGKSLITAVLFEDNYPC